MSKAVLVGNACVLCTLVGCCSGPSRESNVAQIRNKLKNCPSWILSENEDSQTRVAISSAVNELREYDLDATRCAIVEYVDADPVNTSSLAVIYILNRTLFDVSEDASNNVPGFGGWRIPEQNGKLLWPLSLDSNGNLYLSGKFKGYLGPPYRAVEEFDYFRATYGTRKKLRSQIELLNVCVR